MIQDEVLVLLDPNDNSNINYVSEEGDYFEFQQVAVVTYEDELFAILRTVDPDTCLALDEYVVFRIVFEEESAYVLLENDRYICNTIFQRYFNSH